MILKLNSLPLPPLNVGDLSPIFELFRKMWDWIYAFLVNTRFRIPVAGRSFYFSLFSFIVALFVFGIIASVFLNVVRSSAFSTGSSLRSIDRYAHKELSKGEKPDASPKRGR